MTNSVRTDYYFDYDLDLFVLDSMDKANILFCPERKRVPILAI